MRVLDLAACIKFYGEVLRLPEIGHGIGMGGRKSVAFTIGQSILEIQEDPGAVNGRLPSGDPNEEWSKVPGSVNHIALYVDDNDVVYTAFNGKAPQGATLACRGAGRRITFDRLLRVCDGGGLGRGAFGVGGVGAAESVSVG